MRTKRVALLVIALFAVGLVGRAARGSSRTSGVEDGTVAVETRKPFDPRQVLDLLYINRPDSALALAEFYHKANPKDPYPLLLKAKVLRERLNDEDNDKELIRKSTPPIHAVLDSAIALSDEALNRRLKDPRHYYYRGYGWLNKAQLYVLTKNYWSAARASSRGKGDLERYLDKYPDDADARGALGAYLYFADAIPGFAKIVAKLLFLPGGDREKGLDGVRYAATHEGAFSADWRFVMAAIDLVFEGNFEKGTDEFVALLEEYPYYTRLAEPIAVVAPLYPARTRDLCALADGAIERHLALGERFADWNLVKRLQLVLAFTGSYFGQPQEAIEQYSALIEAPPHHPDWVFPIALLNRGYLQQKTGNTDEASKAFDTVRTSGQTAYYRRVAEVMRASIGGSIKTIDLTDLDFVRRIYDGEFDEASRMLERYRKKYGEDALYEFYTGDLELLTGNFTPARHAYERALSREASGGDQIYQMYSAVRLAELSGMDGRYSEARALLKRAQGYCHANYLLDFLIESRQRFYQLIDEGKLDSKPSVLVRGRTRDT